MTDRILFVDDDRALLNTLERNLGFSFPITIAESGPEALEKIRDGEGFAVVMVDMRMPGMDGIEVIQEARKIAPDTVYMMLTGNQDLESATRAVNDGRIYRFLNKPCEMTELKAAIDAARKHYDLVMSEKELLHNTFVGSIGVLTDIIEMMQSNMADSNAISATVLKLADALDFGPSWERQLAAKLSLVGLAMLPDSKTDTLRFAPARSPEHKEVFGEMAEVAAKMIDRIPRLGGVAEMLRLQTKCDGRVQAGEETTQACATLLRVAFYWELLGKNGVPTANAINEIQLALPELPNRITETLAEINGGGIIDEGVVSIGPDELDEGMVLVEDVITDNGALLVSRGRRLSRPIIEKLQQYASQQQSDVTFPIAAPSCRVEAATA